MDEAHYLCAILNSRIVNKAIKSSQTKGLFGERDIHRRPLEVVYIPQFNPKTKTHSQLCGLSKKCHQKVKSLINSYKSKSIGYLRRKIREELGKEIDEIDILVKAMGISKGG